MVLLFCIILWVGESAKYVPGVVILILYGQSGFKVSGNIRKLF